MSRLIERIKRHEGFVGHAYQDSLSYLTIGYGRMIDVRKSGGITKEEAETLLQHDVDRCELVASQFSWYRGLNQSRQEVIVELIFNMGVQNLLEFALMIQAIRDDDYLEAAHQLLASKWRKQVGSKKANELADLLRGTEKPA